MHRRGFVAVDKEEPTQVKRSASQANVLVCIKILNKKRSEFRTNVLVLLLLFQVYCPYDGPRHQSLGHLNRKTHNKNIKNFISKKFILFKTKIKTYFNINFFYKVMFLSLL